MKLKQLPYVVFTSLLMDIFAPAATIADDNQKWICKAEKFCVKDEPSQNLSTIRFESRDDCRLSCEKYGAIWPMPTGDCTLAHERLHFVSSQVRFNVTAPNKESTEFLNEVNINFIANLLKECIIKCASTKRADVLVKIKVKSKSLVLDLETDESYTLSVNTTGQNAFVQINAVTVFGARLGLETLSNLVTGSIKNDLLLVSSAFIDDRPKFAHRGLLLDTARNFYPVPYIRKTLDAMATSKLNVFHWHATDSQSFPLEIPNVPEMARYGAFSPQQIYSRADVQNIIRYALMRGIRTIVEIDGPSHSGNGWQWGPENGLGNLTLCTSPTPQTGHLNPLNENVYGIIKKMYQYFAEVLHPDETIHVGGDEINLNCWNSSEEIISNGTNLYELWAEFHRRNLESYDKVMRSLRGRKTKAPKNVIIWDSDLTELKRIELYLPKERYIINVWKYADREAELREKGYRIIMSNKWYWYLDHGLTKFTNYHGWGQMYNYRINQSSLMLGGEVSLWSELFDEYTFEARIWPRAGAVAERLWSDPDTDYKKAEFRFNRYRERLIARGCRPEVVQLKWCVLNEGEC